MKLKNLVLSLFATVALLSYSSVSSAQFFGWDGEKIIKVMDLPDEEWLQTPNGEYVDAGYIYKQVTILFMPVWNYDGRWIGYIGSEDEYVPLEDGELLEIVELAGLELPDSPSLPFWDTVGGKILFVLLVLFYFGWKSRAAKKEEAAEGAESSNVQPEESKPRTKTKKIGIGFRFLAALLFVAMAFGTWAIFTEPDSEEGLLIKIALAVFTALIGWVALTGKASGFLGQEAKKPGLDTFIDEVGSDD